MVFGVVRVSVPHLKSSCLCEGFADLKSLTYMLLKLSCVTDFVPFSQILERIRRNLNRNLSEFG
jgi:hypothetical protein